MARIRVADLTADIVTLNNEFFSRRFREYRVSDAVPADLCVEITCRPVISEPAGEVVMRHGQYTILRLPDGRFFRCRYAGKSTRITQSIVYTPDFSEAQITLLEGYHHPALTNTEWEYVLTGTMFNDCLTMHGGMVLHSSALSFDGKAVAFSAPSGTGKSTHTGMWKQQYGDRVTVINDDKPALRFTRDGVQLYGTPWSGKTDLNHNVSAPLKAIVFLERGSENRMEPIDGLQAFLLAQCEIMHPYYSEDLGLRSFDILERLIATVPSYQLTCTPTPDAVETVRRALNW